VSLMQRIKDHVVPPGNVMLWWLGQNGFIFKSPAGTTLGVDLYLTDSCEALHPETNLKRQIPVLIEPEDLDIDLFFCTHNHQDHTDPETIRRVSRKNTTRFVGPMPSCEIFRLEGVAKENIVPAWPAFELIFKDLLLRGTFALPTDDSDLNHMGFVAQFEQGPKIYVTGDTDYHELVASAAKHKPDVMIVCINGGFNNLSHWEAAQLAALVKPRIAIGCHYDMFPDNSIDPQQFRAALALKAPTVQFVQLKHGTPFLVPASPIEVS
jgi:L-ascorbate 6-phosphate lactonase